MTPLDKVKSAAHEVKEELEHEFRELQERFRYTVERNKIRFQAAAREYHRTIRRTVFPYFSTEMFLYVVTAPLIYIVIIAFVLLDILISLYQSICFRVYKIPQVKRSAYLVFDRHKLNYLNIVQKLNCEYCAYGNGVLAYASEVASRTEHFWCPIKHAKKPVRHHSRYAQFEEFGDADDIHSKWQAQRDKCRACDECKGH